MDQIKRLKDLKLRNADLYKLMSDLTLQRLFVEEAVGGLLGARRQLFRLACAVTTASQQAVQRQPCAITPQIETLT